MVFFVFVIFNPDRAVLIPNPKQEIFKNITKLLKLATCLVFCQLDVQIGNYNVT